MTSGIAQRTCAGTTTRSGITTIIGSKSVSLSIVFYQLQSIPLANLRYLGGVCHSAIQVHYHHGPCALGDGTFQQAIVYL